MKRKNDTKEHPCVSLLKFWLKRIFIAGFYTVYKNANMALHTRKLAQKPRPNGPTRDK